MAAPRDRVPDWLVERLAAGELPQRQADELRAMLRAQGQEARLDQLAASNAEILAALPPDTAVQEIRRRADRRTQAAPRRAVFAFALAAAVVAVLVVVRGRDGGNGRTVAVNDDRTAERIIIKGDQLEIHRKTQAGAELVRDKDVVRRGDTLQLGYHAEGKSFGVIASVDARGTVTLHLPESAGPAATLEPGKRALPHAYELDDSPGFERFVFVTSDTRFGTAEVASALTGKQPYPAGSKVFTITLTKETP